jgi:hypothetical protein
MKKHRADAQKAKECIFMLLESHRELLSGDEIEALENTMVMLNEYSASIESETQKDEIKSFVIEVLSFITKIAFKIFSEE